MLPCSPISSNIIKKLKFQLLLANRRDEWYRHRRPKEEETTGGRYCNLANTLKETAKKKIHKKSPMREKEKLEQPKRMWMA